MKMELKYIDRIIARGRGPPPFRQKNPEKIGNFKLKITHLFRQKVHSFGVQFGPALAKRPYIVHKQ